MLCPHKITSSECFTAQLEDSALETKYSALEVLNEVVDWFWHEIGDHIDKIAHIQENEDLPQYIRNLAALLLSKVYFHLRSDLECLDYALLAGDSLKIDSNSEYTEVVVVKLIERYAELRSRRTISDEGISECLTAIMNALFEKALAEGSYQHVIGVALESRRLDMLRRAIAESPQKQGITSYCLRVATKFIGDVEFRDEVLNILVQENIGRTNPDLNSLFQCLILLENVDEAATQMLRLYNSSDGDLKLKAYQIAFDLYQDAPQSFTEDLRKKLLEKSHLEMIGSSLMNILSGNIQISQILPFLTNANQADVEILRETLIFGTRRNVTLSAMVICNAFMHAGTTCENFMRSEREKLTRKMTMWGQFLAVGSLGVIHKGNEDMGRQILEMYLPINDEEDAGETEENENDVQDENETEEENENDVQDENETEEENEGSVEENNENVDEENYAEDENENEDENNGRDFAEESENGGVNEEDERGESEDEIEERGENGESEEETEDRGEIGESEDEMEESGENEEEMEEHGENENEMEKRGENEDGMEESGENEDGMEESGETEEEMEEHGENEEEMEESGENEEEMEESGENEEEMEESGENEEEMVESGENEEEMEESGENEEEMGEGGENEEEMEEGGENEEEMEESDEEDSDNENLFQSDENDNSSFGYKAGGALYGLGLIHANRSSPAVIETLIEHLRLSENCFLRHGACLGLGLTAMGLGDSNPVISELLQGNLANDDSMVGDAAAIAMGLVHFGSLNETVVQQMLAFAQETQKERITRGISIGLSLLCFEQLEKAEKVIVQLLQTKDNLTIRRAGVMSIGMAYCGTSSPRAVERLIRFAVSDLDNDIRRAAVIAVGFVLCHDPEECVNTLKLLADSYNPHIRYGISIALGIACAGTGNKDALDIVKYLSNNEPENVVRQGALIGSALILCQQTEAMNSEVVKFRELYLDVIKDRFTSDLVKFGAILAQGIIDAGGRNVTISTQSRSGHLFSQGIIGMFLFTHYWYWFPMSLCLSLSFVPTCVITVDKNLQIRELELISNCKPSLFGYPKRFNRSSVIVERKRIADAILSIMAKDIAKRFKIDEAKLGKIIQEKEHLLESPEVDESKAESNETSNKSKVEPEPTFSILKTPSRVLQSQLKYLQWTQLEWEPMRDITLGGFVVIKDVKDKTRCDNEMTETADHIVTIHEETDNNESIAIDDLDSESLANDDDTDINELYGDIIEGVKDYFMDLVKDDTDNHDSNEDDSSSEGEDDEVNSTM